MNLFPRFRWLCAGFAVLALVACDNAEDRAEGHYNRGVELAEAGEIDKAILEFRNALQLNQDAVKPRLAFGLALLEKQDFQGAVGNLLKVIEIEPDNLEARSAVGRVLLLANQTTDAAPHLDAAYALAPENVEVRGLHALLQQRSGQTAEAGELARGLLADVPGDALASVVLVEQATAIGDYAGAVTLLDAAIAASPEDFSLYLEKLRALEALDDQPAIGAQLDAMAEKFPQDANVLQGRVQWFLNQNRGEEAIAAQRQVAAEFPDDPGNALNVAALLNTFTGADAARAELETLSASGAHRVVFTRALADFDAQNDDLAGATARLAALSASDITDAERNDVDVHRSVFLTRAGDVAEAQVLVEAVLAEDAEHVEALKQRALYAIDQDRAQDAITDLRTALGVRAQNPEILMLLATAHERNGSLNLAQERLALAVQASDQGVAEVLRYVSFLGRQNKAGIAEGVLDDALIKNGEVPALLSALAQTQLKQSKWVQADTTADRLEALDASPEAADMATTVRLAVLSGQQKFEQTIGVLREMWDVAGERSSAMENLVRSYVQTGQLAEAAAFLDDILTDDAKNIRASLLRGALFAYEGDTAAAETVYRQVIADHPTQENGYGALASLLLSEGRLEEADAVTREGIERAENTERLLFARATRLEQEGDYEGAIAIYEQLYDANKVSDILANNLASLLSQFRDDPESLERAFNISMRLRGSDQPAFQDTYGWILYRRGEYERALQPLTAAAEAASNNVYVQYHLGMTYEKLGQKDRAIAQLSKALELGQGQNLPMLDDARLTLERLQAN